MQRSRYLPFLLLLGTLSLSAQEVYKWVDENGVTHYSDQPVPGAERVRIETRPSPRSSAPRTPSRAPLSAPPGNRQPAQNEPFSYQSLSFTQPAAEQTLWNIGGTLTVRLSLQPGLRSGDQLRLYFDGEARTVNGLQVQLDEVWRGTHNLQAEVVDANGELMIRSEPLRFYVQQTSVLNP